MKQRNKQKKNSSISINNEEQNLDGVAQKLQLCVDDGMLNYGHDNKLHLDQCVNNVTTDKK